MWQLSPAIFKQTKQPSKSAKVGLAHEVGFPGDFALDLGIGSVYRQSTRHEVMKPRREVQNNDHTIKLLFTLDFWEARGEMVESAAPCLPWVCLWPGLAAFDSPVPQYCTIATKGNKGSKGM